MTTFNWNCKTVDVYPAEGEFTDVVYNVHWIVNGVYDQLDPQGNPYTGRIIGTQVLDTSTITDFIPFEDLTNEQVVTWTKDTMGVEQVTQIETSIDEQIADKVNPTSITMVIEG